MGTIAYNVKYLTDEKQNLKSPIDSILKASNQSLSTYIPDSEISQFNKTDSLAYPSDMFLDVLMKSEEIYRKTNGAFDPTIGPLVNAWGFGPDKQKKVLDSAQVDSLLQLIGFDQITFSEQLVTKPRGVYLDFSAIAKGYAVDLVAEFLESKNLEHYMVEIGGEVRARGTNEEGNTWTIGIEDPLVAKNEQKLIAIVALDGRSLATSGNYRNYFQEDGKTYAHILDPRTGYSQGKQILSASIFARTCIEADALATAAMILDVDQAQALVNTMNDIDAVFIRENTEGNLETVITDGIADQVKRNNTL
jgi:thiamine biosynthesis lipoprotein